MTDTKIFRIDPDEPDMEAVRQASDIISAGGLLALPTETVYGLGANALDPKAAEKIYAAKGRPSDNPLIVHIAELDTLEKIATGDLSRAKRLAKAFWPGPLTMVLQKAATIPVKTTGGLNTVAVRMPRPNATRLIIRHSKCPVAAPSANISGKPSPTCAAHVMQDFSGRIDGVVDCGSSPIGVESTVLDITGAPTILRRGFVLPEEIEAVLGEHILISDKHVKEGAPKAPGMKYRHYSPRASLTIVEGEDKKVIEWIRQQITVGKKTGVLCSEETKDSYKGCNEYILGSRRDGSAIMQNIYATLRQLDADGIEEAFSEAFWDNDYSETIMERLYKAAGKDAVRL